MAKWYKKITEGIPGSILFKKDVNSQTPDKCPQCFAVCDYDNLAKDFFICQCGHHFNIGSIDYFNLFFDHQEYELLFKNILPTDVLGFTDLIPYSSKLSRTQQKTKTEEAITIATGKWNDINLVVGAMDFSFIGGTMGSVVGEKIKLTSEYCIKNQLPLVLISKSGGARLMEGMYSLMQMVKTSLAAIKLADHKIPFISILTDPVMGGVTASYGLIADIVLAEPNALVGYTGPRIIKESTGKEPPKDFQKAEFLFKNGFIDIILPRTEIKEKVVQIIDLLVN